MSEPAAGPGKAGNHMYSYLMAHGEGNKGASYKYKWRPDWRLPPGVNQGKVLLHVAFWLALAAIPVYGLPYLRQMNAKEGDEKKPEDVYQMMKQRNKEERMKWIQSPDMPYK